MPIGPVLRHAILERDGYRCRHCGATAQEARLHVDHILNEAMGGASVAENLQTLCSTCNSGKGAIPVDAATLPDPNELAQRWMRAMKAAIEIRRARGLVVDEELDELDEAWARWRRSDDAEAPIPRPDAWRSQVERYVLAGLPVREMLPLVTIAMTNATNTHLEFPQWFYFLGCCKRALHDIEETARKLMLVAADPEAVLPGEDPDRIIAPTLDDLP